MPWGSYDPVITLKPLWGSPGTELSTWSIGSLCCIRAVHRSRFASWPLRSYTGYTTPLCTCVPLLVGRRLSSFTDPAAAATWIGPLLVEHAAKGPADGQGQRRVLCSLIATGGALQPHLPAIHSTRAGISSSAVGGPVPPHCHCGHHPCMCMCMSMCVCVHVPVLVHAHVHVLVHVHVHVHVVHVGSTTLSDTLSLFLDK